jgi:hypothetical protein
MIKEILKLIDKKFIERLHKKTGWGRNEIIEIYHEIVNEAVMDVLSSKLRDEDK